MLLMAIIFPQAVEHLVADMLSRRAHITKPAVTEGFRHEIIIKYFAFSPFPATKTAV